MIFGGTRARCPLSGGPEFTEPDFDAEGPDGEPDALMSHVRLAHPDDNDGVPDPAAGLAHRWHRRTPVGWARAFFINVRPRSPHPVRADADRCPATTC